MSVELRLSSEKEIDLLLPFVRAYHEFEELNTTDEQRESSVRTLLSNPELGRIWMIYSKGAPAGYVALGMGYSIEFGGRDAIIDEFYIRPEFRGRGLGASALDLLKNEARARKPDMSTVSGLKIGQSDQRINY